MIFTVAFPSQNTSNWIIHVLLVLIYFNIFAQYHTSSSNYWHHLFSRLHYFANLICNPLFRFLFQFTSNDQLSHYHSAWINLFHWVKSSKLLYVLLFNRYMLNIVNIHNTVNYIAICLALEYCYNNIVFLGIMLR